MIVLEQTPPGEDALGPEEFAALGPAERERAVRRTPIEAQFTALRYFALDGTGHPSHREQGSMIRRYIMWRNKHAQDERLREVVNRANAA
nr:hypothetical protein [Streptomyces sp. A1277]